MSTRPHHRPLLGLLALPLLVPTFTTPLAAQERVEIRRPAEGTITIARGGAAAGRRLLGLAVRATGDGADTTGLLIERVADSSAAAIAGVKAGERLVSIDGTPLQLDRRDVGDRAATGVIERRLTRVLEGKKAGDQVSLVVSDGSRRRTVRATLKETPMAARTYGWNGPWGGPARTPRRVLGVTLAEGGSARDTAGLLITEVSKGSAAEKAGIGPGDRLVSIDGTDLRVDAADAGDAAAASARVGRLRRALDAAKDSQPVRLEVLQDGRRRTVQAVPQREQGWSWGAGAAAPGAMMFRGPDGEGVELELRGLREAQRGLAEQRRVVEMELPRIRAEQRRLMERELPRMREEMRREFRMVPPDAPLPPDAPFPPGMTFERRAGRPGEFRVDGPPGRPGDREAVRVTVREDGGNGRHVMIERNDISVSTVNKDLAAKLGRGTEGGLLVLRVSDDYAPLKAGDVILKVDGTAVSDRDARLDIGRDRPHRVEVIRDGRTQVLELKAH